MCAYLFIIILAYLVPCVYTNVCRNPNLQIPDDLSINKDVDICTMFMQSYSGSIDMGVTVKDYLLKYLPKTYLDDGHLRLFTQYEKNYTFLLATAIDHMSIENDDHKKKYYNKEIDNQDKEEKKTNFQYLSINWNESNSEILQNIAQKFEIIQECSSTITFYLTFPSYPEKDLLSNFLKTFKTASITPPSSFSSNNNDNLYYRNNIDPSFLSFVDILPLPIFQELLRQYSNVRLVLCGHGLGGTVAQLSTLHLLSKEVTLHHAKLRSISVGSLFFAKEETKAFINNHHLEKHFNGWTSTFFSGPPVSCN
ncbi:unnamed protein product [Adineta steineri]|uniref:Fungal lipase-type domain-containing protein n=1 Tax=Adineta steineri TaxID=433720 RepID=A0A818HBN6_9BILA|nr:unnamed protein product [Adineta steineri]CAF0946363.1 unnamed protein product [Adineta steineri]CAF3482852.1 unnamed protein product [Adineta steineri]CAF3505765.1 unnamed protein product [Adineta steineri]